MANWILFGILLGVVLVSAVVLSWQVILLILDIRSILRSVNGITERLDPTIEEVNQILHKSNQVLDEAGNTYKNANQNLGDAKVKASSLKTRIQHTVLSLKVGVSKGVEVFKSGGLSPAYAIDDYADELEDELLEV